jgi:membrane protein
MNKAAVLFRRARRWWRRRDEATRELPLYLWRALTNFANTGASQAAALAYYAIFSVFPLTLLLTVAINQVLGPTVAQQQIASALTLFLPIKTAELLRVNVTAALQQSSSFGLIALIGLAWSGLGLFSSITASLDAIFQVPARRSLWRQRLLALVMAVILIVLVTASFVTSGVLRLVSAALLERPNIWVTIGVIFLPLGLDIVIFALLFRYIPARQVHWDAVWPAAIFGGVGWELAKAGFSWYLTNVSNFQFIYGSIATAIVLLFWAYLIASIFLLSAEMCAQLNEWFLKQERRALEQLRAETERPPALTTKNPAFRS